MENFPDFMKHPSNRVNPTTQYTPGIEGYVFDGADGSQIAFWRYSRDAESAEHSHPYDEYIAIVQGQYVLFVADQAITLNPGDEYHIPKGVVHGGKAIAGTLAIYAFGGKRVNREGEHRAG